MTRIDGEGLAEPALGVVAPFLKHGRQTQQVGKILVAVALAQKGEQLLLHLGSRGRAEPLLEGLKLTLQLVAARNRSRRHRSCRAGLGQHGLLQSHRWSCLQAQGSPQAEIGLAVDSPCKVPGALLAELLGVREETLGLLENRGRAGRGNGRGRRQRRRQGRRQRWLVTRRHPNRESRRRGRWPARRWGADLAAQESDQSPAQTGTGAACGLLWPGGIGTVTHH